MLLLVLILVLIAFGLLVVALLSGSVLSAWLSVAVSVVAAVVLLVDWLQRRSALKAGDEEPDREKPVARTSLPDVDPATEVLPVVPSAAGRGAPHDAGQQTVVMPVVQPSGSSTQPSGAEGDVTPSSEFPSPSVTDDGVDRSPDSSAPESGRPTAGTAEPSRPDAAEATVVADLRGTGRTDGEAPAVSDQPGDGTDAADRSAPPPAGEGPEPERTVAVPAAVSLAKPDRSQAGPTRDTPVEDQAGSAAPAGSGPAGATAAAEEPARETASTRSPAAGGPAAEPTAAETSEAPEPARAAATAPEHRNGAPETRAVRGLFDAGDDEAVSTPPPSERAGAEQTAQPAAEQTVTSGAEHPAGPDVEQSAAEEPADEASTAEDGEPPEERREPTVARVVAGLTDEVLVIDEHPRYHIAACRALTGVAVIPLPAQEAVELGFTPCGWCTPDATLAGRHSAGARP